MFSCLNLHGQQTQNITIDDLDSLAVINRELTSRQLTWNDFKGEPDNHSPYHAFTIWKIKAEINIKFRQDTAVFSFHVYAEFKDSSWVMEGKKSDYLLKHEQGHFDIGKLCAMEITETIKRTIFLKTEFPAKYTAILEDIQEKYHLLNLQYDSETNHSHDKDGQNKWNTFFKEKLETQH
jgi:hypothetical protein